MSTEGTSQEILQVSPGQIPVPSGSVGAVFMVVSAATESSVAVSWGPLGNLVVLVLGGTLMSYWDPTRRSLCVGEDPRDIRSYDKVF